jgi:predicted transcriptional regulator
MDKIFSTRIDEAMHKRIGLLSQKLNISKKALIERAIAHYSDNLDINAEIDPLKQTLGAWNRNEQPETTIKNARKAFQKSMKRHQE